MKEKEAKLLFTDYFQVSKKAVDDYGAFNISGKYPILQTPLSKCFR